jgi:hypothetical protein
LGEVLEAGRAALTTKRDWGRAPGWRRAAGLPSTSDLLRLDRGRPRAPAHEVRRLQLAADGLLAVLLEVVAQHPVAAVVDEHDGDGSRS